MTRIICPECKNAYIQDKDGEFICPSCEKAFSADEENFLSGVQYYNDGDYEQAGNHLMKYIVKSGAQPKAIFYKVLCDCSDFDEDTVSLNNIYDKLKEVFEDIADEDFPKYAALANDELEKIEKNLVENQVRLFADADAEKIKRQVATILGIQKDARNFRDFLTNAVTAFNERSNRKLSAKFSDCFFVDSETATEVGNIKYQKICDNIASHTVFTGILSTDIKNLEIYYRCIVMFFQKSHDKYDFLMAESAKFFELAETLEKGRYNTIKGTAAIGEKLKSVSYDFLEESYKEHFDEEINVQTQTIVITEPEPVIEETVSEVTEDIADNSVADSTENVSEECESGDNTDTAEQETAVESISNEQPEAQTQNENSGDEQTDVSEKTAIENSCENEVSNESDKTTENISEQSEDVTCDECDGENHSETTENPIEENTEKTLVETQPENAATTQSQTDGAETSEQDAQHDNDDTYDISSSSLEEVAESSIKSLADILAEKSSPKSQVDISEDEISADNNDESVIEIAVSDENAQNSEELEKSQDKTVIDKISADESGTKNDETEDKVKAAENAVAEEKGETETETKETENADTKPRKKAKKKSKKGLVCFIIIIIAVLGLCAYKYAPGIINGYKYKQADSLAAEKKYSQAAEMYKELENYGDSKEKYNECAYNAACELEENGKHSEAKAAFEALGEYKDCLTRVKACTYSEAAAALEAKNYDEAEKLFNSVKDYGDSSDMVKECSYIKAADLLEEKQYESAIEILSALGKYSDSADKIKEAKYMYITDNFDKKNKTTVKYIKELAKINYRNSAELKTELLGEESDNADIAAFVNYSSSDLKTKLTKLDNSKQIYFHIVVNDKSLYGKTLTLKYTTAFGYSQSEKVTPTQSDNTAKMVYPATQYQNYTVEFAVLDESGTKLAGQTISF